MNDIQTKLSFIVPCYNVGNYIDLCLDSIFSCSIPKDEYEVLCIDDYSTDNTTKEKLKAFGKKHSNIHIIQHSTNLGPGASRNDGIDAAKGEYLWFVDADDTVQTDSVETLLRKALCSNVDVLCFNYSDVDNRGGRIGNPKVFKDTDIKTGLAFTYDTFDKGLIYHIGYPVRFLSRRDYIIENKLFFPQGVYFEDTVWMPKLLLLADKVQGCDVIGYNYWHHETSIMGTFASNPSVKKIFDWSIATGQQLYDFSKELRLLGKPYFEYSDISEFFNFLY